MEIREVVRETLIKHPSARLVAWGPKYLKHRLPNDDYGRARYSLDYHVNGFTIDGEPVETSGGESLTVTDDALIREHRLNA